MARTVFCGKPFSVRHMLWLYCASGFSAVSASAAQASARAESSVMNLTVSVRIRLSVWRRNERSLHQQDNRARRAIAIERRVHHKGTKRTKNPSSILSVLCVFVVNLWACLQVATGGAIIATHSSLIHRAKG